MAFAFGQFVGIVLATALLVALTSLVSAFTLQIATSTDESLNFSPSFGFAYRVSLHAGLIAAAIYLVLAFFVGIAGKELSVGGYALLGLVAFITNASLISAKLRHPERGNIGFGRACWLTTLQIVFSFMLVGAFMKLFEFITK